VDSVLPRRTAITEHSKMLADDHRQKLKYSFTELQVHKSLTITPDLWTDKFNSSSYLGITCTTINSDFVYSSFDLVMHKYAEPDKKAENIAIVCKTHARPLAKILFVCFLLCSDRPCVKHFRHSK
jgi:hypothetical protein